MTVGIERSPVHRDRSQQEAVFEDNQIGGLPIPQLEDFAFLDPLSLGQLDPSEVCYAFKDDQIGGLPAPYLDDFDSFVLPPLLSEQDQSEVCYALNDDQIGGLPAPYLDDFDSFDLPPLLSEQDQSEVCYALNDDQIGGLPIAQLEDYAFLHLPSLGQQDHLENSFCGIGDSLCESPASQSSCASSSHPKYRPNLLGASSAVHVETEAVKTTIQGKQKLESKIKSKQPCILKSVVDPADVASRKVVPKDRQGDRMDRKKYGPGGEGRKKTVLKKADELCTLTGNRVFAGVADGRADTIWPPVDYKEIIGSYRLRRDIQSYQLSKEAKRKKPRSIGFKADSKKQESVTFPPLTVGLLQNCVADLLRKIQDVDEKINRTADHNIAAFDAYDVDETIISPLKKIPSPGPAPAPAPALLDYTADVSREYRGALNDYAYDIGVDASEAYSEFEYVLGWCFADPAL